MRCLHLVTVAVMLLQLIYYNAYFYVYALIHVLYLILLYDSIGFVFRYHYILSIKIELFTMLSVFASNNR